MHDTQKVQEDKDKQCYEKPFSVAELHRAAFGTKKRSHYYEIDEDDDADCYCD